MTSSHMEVESEIRWMVVLVVEHIHGIIWSHVMDVIVQYVIPSVKQTRSYCTVGTTDQNILTFLKPIRHTNKPLKKP